MKRCQVNSLAAYLVILVALITMLLNACSSSSAQTAEKKNPTIESDHLLSVLLFNEQGNLTFRKTRMIKLSKPTQLTPNPTGDHALIVVDKNGKLQYITFFSTPKKVWFRKVNPLTGLHYSSLEEFNFPIARRVPVNKDTKEVYIMNPNKERIIDIPFDPSQIDVKEESIDVKKTLKNVTSIEDLSETYQNIEFTILDQVSDTLEYLSDNGYVLQIHQALNKIPSTEVINSIEDITILRNPMIEMVGGYEDGFIFVTEDVLLGETSTGIEEVIVHESAHRYIDYINGDRLMDGEYNNVFDDMMADLNSFWESEWSDVELEWASMQENYRNLRSLSDCPGEEFDESQFDYGFSEGPTSSDKQPSIEQYLQNGFVTPYASSDVSEDIADTFTYAVLYPELLAHKIEPGNIYDQKTEFLVELGMLPQLDYHAILTLSEISYESTLLLFSYQYKGAQKSPLTFYLNEAPLLPSFFGTGSKSVEIGDGLKLIEDENVLSLSTVYDEEGDADDIEVEGLLIEAPRPVSATTGCDQSIAYLDAPDPIHLGNGNCPDDSYCASYSALKGESYIWIF